MDATPRDAGSRRCSLLGWLDEPAGDRGIRFAGPGEQWDLVRYDELAGFAQDVAAGLAGAGVRRHDRVVIVLRSGPGFVATFFGALLAGATPAPVAPPSAFQSRAAYQSHLHRVLRVASPALVVTEGDLVAEVGAAASRAEVARTVPVEELRAEGPAGRPTRREPAELALVQFTSGSSGPARGVRVPYPALEANLAAIGSWLDYQPGDPTASWLPVHHDMGLIGCLLTPVAYAADLWLLPPAEFVRSPVRYLRCFGVHGARLTALPTFGLDYVVRRVRPGQLAGMDFSAWRAVIVGAERVTARTLDRFHELLGPYGLRRRALLPAYGLAEATLVATAVPLREEWSALRVDPARLTPGRAIAGPGGGTAGVTVVGCGRPVVGGAVTVVDDAGRPQPDGHVGEIVVRGTSVAAGYLTDHPGAPDAPAGTGFGAGGLVTGDAGFLVDGQLYVLGRLGDSVKVRGRTLYAEEVEAIVAEAGVPPERVAAALGVHRGEPTAAVVLEAAEAGWLARVEPLLRHRVDGARVVTVTAPRGAVPRTSSGKPKRRELWRMFVTRRLPR